MEAEIASQAILNQFILVGGILGIIASVVGATAVIVRKLTCARGLAEQALDEAEEAKEMAERNRKEFREEIIEAQRQAKETHNKIFEKLDEIYKITSKLG